MKHIFLNLKRFDIPTEYGGVNRLAAPAQWAESVVKGIQGSIDGGKAHYAVFLPEAHLLAAAAAKSPESPLEIGSQSVYREDTAPGGNFGAFTTGRPAAAVKALGCTETIIGHCEERKNYAGILAEAGVTDSKAVSRILCKEIRAAQARGLRVLYCIGETAEERSDWKNVLKMQLETGLEGADRENVVIAYEPIWAIGPGKTPPGRETIQETAQYIKELTGGMDIVYGGGLKADNAAMLASIPEIDGGLIALTRFSGEIGFYPEEYLEIVSLYLGN